MMNQAEMAHELIASLDASGAVFALSPGSRSTPLVLHLPTQKQHTVVHDERALGFFGVGLSRVGKLPVLITTSGTAVANLLPAVVEAKQDELPLILLTADRPASDYGLGANQTINQKGIFAHHVVESFELDSTKPCDVSALVDEVVTASRVGPVHVNVHLRKPLEQKNTVVNRPATVTRSSSVLGVDFPNDIDLILVGQCSRNEAIVAADYAEKNSIPLFLDIQSGSLGHGTFPLSELVHRAGALDSFEHALVVGSRFTEHRVWEFLRDHVSQVTQSCSMVGTFDPLSVVDRRVSPPVSKTQEPIKNSFEIQAFKNDTKLLHRNLVKTTISAITSGEVCENLFIGNSLVIRAFDRFRPRGVWFGPNVYANRGASGIDGNIATSAGIATTGKTMCFIGDQTFLHDIGALVSFGSGSQLRIVVIDNAGGRIFEHLPELPENDLERYFVNRGISVSSLVNAFTRRGGEFDRVGNFRSHIETPVSGFEIVVAHVNPEQDLIDFRGER